MQTKIMNNNNKNNSTLLNYFEALEDMWLGQISILNMQSNMMLHFPMRNEQTLEVTNKS